jgi:hypothetical protein
MFAADAGGYRTRNVPTVDLEKYRRAKPRQKLEPQLEQDGDKPAPRSWIGGIPQPTLLEIAEGRAYFNLLLEPDNDCLQSVHRAAWNQLMMEQKGSVGLVRCGLCHTTKWGRLLTDACCVCKSKSGYYG